ncbi:sigma 54-interacting transcriptional regulator [uncultured Thiohalocapsa sp.]|uniref:sigma 54-interacting transcriptional regulator n=1 Tax=uncultured Thiohalocapsa sp. TaxID=768990 RepID=UPI0025E44CCF|nr:sigma 54-interacting transcriptional regulator [uncultured Thiohalocapsa sp.]
MSTSDTAITLESELLVIQQAARIISRSDDPEAAIQGILRLLSQLLGLNRGRVLLVDPSTATLAIRYAYGLTDEERARGRYALGEGITGRVFQTGQMEVVQDIDAEPSYLTRAVARGVLPQEPVAFLALPIQQHEQTIGVLAVHRLRQRERPFQRDLALLQVIATLVAQVLRVNDLVAERTAQLLSENRLLKNRLESRGASYGIIGQSPALHQAINQTLQVAATKTTVLLLGESGTGKERFARMQHVASKRADGPFVSVNCAAIPANLLESELFGHEKGAFTGAQAVKKGRMELADGGTLFLDEIGDLDLELQAKLLRVLEYKVVQRVGGTRDIPVDVRIVAATHQNLQEAVNDGRFRLDLFYRLNVFPIRLPPLRARAGDVPILARHFLNAANQEYGRNQVFGPGALELLERFGWPGNIRQLENLVKRAVLMSTESVIRRDLVQEILVEEEGIRQPGAAGAGTEPGGLSMAAPAGAGASRAPADPVPLHHSEPMTAPGAGVPGNPFDSAEPGLRPYARVRHDERDHIEQALRRHHGNKTRAALSLGLTPRQLRYRIVKLGIATE